MSRFQADQLRAFVEATDRCMKRRARLLVIGGSAALLQHGARSATRDIDVYEGDVDEVRDAAMRAGRQLGYAVPIQVATIGDLPLHHNDRLHAPLPHLKKLKVLVPDRYDLILSKLLRAAQGDLVVFREMHEHSAFDLTVLLDRYTNEMNHVIGRQADRDQNILAAIEWLWGEARADQAERALRQARKPKR